MFCAKCGSPVPDGQSACPACPVRLFETGSATVAAAPALVGRKPSSKLQIIAVILYAALLLVPVFWLGITRSSGNTAYATGQVFGRCLIPAILVTLYYRKKNASVARIAFSLVTWMFVGNVIGLGRLSSPGIRESDIPAIVREAAGLAPLPAHDSPDRASLRDAYRTILDGSKKYEAELARLDQTPAAATFNQPVSFASRENIEHVLEYLKASRENEATQAGAMDRFAADVGARVERFDWPRSSKDAFMKGLLQALAGEGQAPKQALTAKVAWLDQSIDLYEFSLSHHDQIRVSGPHIGIEDATVRDGFNQRLHAQEKSRKEFLALVETANATRRRAQERFGVSSKELGLHQ